MSKQQNKCYIKLSRENWDTKENEIYIKYYELRHNFL